MTLQKPIPLLLLMFTVVCALPAAAGAAVVPSAIAQEEEDEENLASGIVSDVLDNSGNAEDESNQDATNTADEDSNQGQDVDQDDTSAFGDDSAELDNANVAIPLGIPIDIDVTEEVPIATPPEEEQPEFVAFCFQAEGEPFLLCFSTSEECTGAEEFLLEVTEIMILENCKGFETIPPNAADCTFTQNEQATGVDCIDPQT
jgi:hypothetical protein